MADHYVALARGVEGFKASDFTTGTSSAATAAFEFRSLDGTGATRKDAVNALKAFIRFIETAPLVKAAGFDLKG